MINAKELRIGNWVQVGGSPVQIEPADLYIKDFTKYNCEPIPLTPEILQQCGFDTKTNRGSHPDGIPWISYDYLYNNNLADILIRFNPECYIFFKFNLQAGITYSSKELRYYDTNIVVRKEHYPLHKLQNLYYCLTGEELNFQPKIQKQKL